ncbi:MAG: DUF523 domain-containing protein [Christensenellales bacterium]
MDRKNIVISDRIAIGVSACCMGSPVRYNAKGWDQLAVMGREKNDFKWCPVCPECMAGLGVPRDPIHLTGGDGSLVWTGGTEVKNRHGRLVTEDVKYGALSCLETLKRAGVTAFVYMEGSPSCGVYRTTLKDTRRGHPPGIFGALLLQQGFFLIPAADLQSPLKWWDWRRRLLAFYWLRGLELKSKNDLYEAWARLKFLFQELDPPFAQAAGRKLAALEGAPDSDFIAAFRAEALEVLRKPSTVKRITNSLWKNYAYYRKTVGKTVEGVNSPTFQRNITAIAKELVTMERKALDDEVLFGTSPVMYREKRRLPRPDPEEAPAAEADLQN